jgi:extracellular elastinolytic metalloproteinase
MRIKLNIRSLSGAFLLLYALSAEAAGGYLTGPNQGAPLDIALNYLNENQAVLGLSNADLSNQVVKDQYVTAHNGVTHIYLRQQHKGIEVFGGDMAIHIASDGSVIKLDNQFVPRLRRAVNTRTPSISAKRAVKSTAQHLGLNMTSDVAVLENFGGADHSKLLTDGGISLDDIPVKLVYQQAGKGEVRLAWNVRVRQSDHWWNLRIDAVTGEVLDQNDWIANDNDYRVFPLPAVSPEEPGIPHSLVNAPADAIASPLGWHDTDGVAGAEYTDTRGNNVYAQEDTNADDTGGFRPDGGADLIFDFDWDPALQPWEGTNQEAAIVNLFYWNNIIHDVFYRYGFDEVSGNFQKNNYGNGGLDGDPVQADAQDGAGMNNATFATPPDGEEPRMQVFLWNKTSPQRDGDFESTIIIHEYGHGISNRLVGGPSNVSCLGNDEQMGEGWSDWLALILTTKDTDTDTSARGMGPYVLGQLPDGAGIRLARYTTDMSENGYTYGDISRLDIPYDVGFVWATMLWEMQWNLINQHSFDSDVYMGNGGNNLAIQLVIDGMKLTACNPGFVDARDAILLADKNNNGGANQCLIWKAFAKRGLGYSADQGSSDSTTDGTEAFDIPTECLDTLNISKSASPSPVEAGGLLDYTLKVGNYTSGKRRGVTITDSVPANTTYVEGSADCGGSESGGIVTFPLGTMNSGEMITCTFQVQVSGSVGNTVLFADDMESGADKWTVSHGEGSSDWTLGNSTPHSGISAWYAEYTLAISDQYLAMTNPVVLSGTPILRFWHHYNHETNSYGNYDGGVVEISTDSGATWTDLGSEMTPNGYTGTISTCCESPIAGRRAFTGNSNGYIETLVDLSSYMGQSVQIRFRMATDNGGTSYRGWYVDDVEIVDKATIFNEACVSANEGDSDCASVRTPVISLPVVSPESLASTQAVNTQTMQVLNIGNVDSVDLAWTIDEAASSCSSPEDISWLRTSPSSGTTAPGDSSVVDVVFDSTGLNVDMYKAILCVNSNDTTVEVPVSLDVTGPPNDVVIDFGPSDGISAWLNNSTWQPVHSLSAYSMVTGDIDDSGQDDVIINFGSVYGIWMLMNNWSWESLHLLSAESMVTGDLDGSGEVDVIIDFGQVYGIWMWMNNSFWVPLDSVSPESMVTGDLDGNGEDDVVIDSGTKILLWMNNSTWVQLHTISSEGMVTGDLDGSGEDDVVIDLGPAYGLWLLMNNSTRFQLHPESPEGMVTGDLDGNGEDDVIIDFGAEYGIWRWMNNRTWVRLRSFSVEAMVTGNLDSNSQDDVIISSSDPEGIWAFMNNRDWVKLDDRSAESMVTGEIDGVSSFGVSALVSQVPPAGPATSVLPPFVPQELPFPGGQ